MNQFALDAGLIISAQKVEHYEIASYGGLCSWAEQMSHNDALELLRQTLDDEKAADEKLTEVAETIANTQAEQGQGFERCCRRGRPLSACESDGTVEGVIGLGWTPFATGASEASWDGSSPFAFVKSTKGW